MGAAKTDVSHGEKERNKQHDAVKKRNILEVLEQLREFTSPARKQRAFPLMQTVPLKVAEPRVLHDALETILELFPVLRGPNARLGSSEQAGQKVNAFGRQRCLGLCRHFQALSPAQNLAAGRDRIVGVKGRVANQTFKHNHSEGPPVYSARVGITGCPVLCRENLGGNVVRCTNRRICHLEKKKKKKKKKGGKMKQRHPRAKCRTGKLEAVQKQQQ
jgi:hypothetical protein